MIQERYAGLICTSAAALLNQSAEKLTLVPGGATWLGQQGDLLVFVLSDVTGKKYVVSAKFANRGLKELMLL